MRSSVFLLALNDTHLNSYSLSSDPLKIGPELTLDYSLDNLICYSAWEYAGALCLANGVP